MIGNRPPREPLDDRQPCPASCGGSLGKLGEREDLTALIGADRFIYRCTNPKCRRVWIDDLDGQALKEVRE